MEQRPTWKILLLMKRRPGMSVEAFRDYYENQHIPLCKPMMTKVARYIRRYLEPQPHAESLTNAELPYDVITELWFTEERVFKQTRDYLAMSVLPQEIVQDELNLFDRPTMRMATVVECEG
jgi:hypothetical protein